VQRHIDTWHLLAHCNLSLPKKSSYSTYTVNVEGDVSSKCVEDPLFANPVTIKANTKNLEVFVCII